MGADSAGSLPNDPRPQLVDVTPANSSVRMARPVSIALFTIVWAVSLFYGAHHLKRGWIAHDDGAFAQSAERVLNGELPHRDFDELYTGGLTFANALAFRVLGVNLASLRILLFVFFVAWVPAVYYIASRFVSPYSAAGITLLSVVYSLPNYSAAVPSWYNLFFAVFGTAALLRYLETNATRWLFVAGLCGGLSTAIKIPGLYFIAAGLLFLVYLEQCLEMVEAREPVARSRAYALTVTLFLIAFLFLVVEMIHSFPGLNQTFNFVLPPVAVSVVLLRREWRGVPGGARTRFATLLKLVVPFAAGVALPILVFLIAYFRSGAVPALIRGAFIMPAKRLGYAVIPSTSFVEMLAMLPILLVIVTGYYSGKKARNWCAGIVAVALIYVLWSSATNHATYWLAWYSIESAIPLVVFAGSVILAYPRFSTRLSVERQQQLMLLICVLAVTTLVQFPFSAQIYFCYVAPILWLATGAVISVILRPPRLVLATLLAFYGLFVFLRVTPGFVFDMGEKSSPDSQTETLQLPRSGGLRVEPDDADTYRKLIPLVQAHAKGEFIYAAPDAPAVYFLAGKKNPTRTLFDFFDEQEGRDERILASIESHHVNVVVFNSAAAFSEGLNDDVDRVLADRFPYSQRVNEFEVRWRD